MNCPPSQDAGNELPCKCCLALVLTLDGPDHALAARGIYPERHFPRSAVVRRAARTGRVGAGPGRPADPWRPGAVLVYRRLSQTTRGLSRQGPVFGVPSVPDPGKPGAGL